MDILKIIEMIASFLLMAVSVIMIFDARRLTKKLFSFSDQNNGSKWMKIGGLVIFLAGIRFIICSNKIEKYEADNC